MKLGFRDTGFRYCCNLLVQGGVSRVMETRNENLVQSNDNVYEELHEVLLKYQRSLENLEKALSQLSMYLLGERLFLEEMERVYGMQESMQALGEFLSNRFDKSSSE